MQQSYCYPYPHPAVTTDIAVFSISDNQLKLLLIKRAQEPYKDMWALPGGFLEPNEDLETCARRELQEETGLNNLYLEQLCTMGNPGRDPRERVISVAYLALCNTDQTPMAASDAAAASWHSYNDLPRLAFDHAEIISAAYQRLRSKLEYSNIAVKFLPGTFTLTELQKVFEIIRNRSVDKRNFRKQILSTQLIEATELPSRKGKHRPARLYQATCRNQVQFLK